MSRKCNFVWTKKQNVWKWPIGGRYFEHCISLHVYSTVLPLLVSTHFSSTYTKFFPASHMIMM